MPWLRRSLALLLAAHVAALAVPPPAHAQKPGKSDRERSALARQAFENGKKAYNNGDFDRAIDLWKQAYEYRDDPIFLFNIAQAYRQRGDAPKAIFFYRAYLRESPRAKNRADVEARIVELQHQVDSQPAPEPPKPEPEPPAPAPTPPPVAVPPPSSVTVPEPGPIDEPPPARSGRPLLVGGLVTGGVGVAALAAGVLFTLKSSSLQKDLEDANRAGMPWTPALRDKEAEGKLDSTIGVVGLAVGAAAVVTGATLVWLGARPTSAPAERDLRISLSPSGLGVSLTLTR